MEIRKVKLPCQNDKTPKDLVEYDTNDHWSCNPRRYSNMIDWFDYLNEINPRIVYLYEINTILEELVSFSDSTCKKNVIAHHIRFDCKK